MTKEQWLYVRKNYYGIVDGTEKNKPMIETENDFYVRDRFFNVLEDLKLELKKHLTTVVK